MNKTLKIKRSHPTRFFSVHTHSKYSVKDALPSVDKIVERAAELGYRGLGLTDHGNMAGSIELYQNCMAKGIKPFPGTELYAVEDRADKKAKRFHMGMLAYTTQGYRNLVEISTISHRQFHHKPLIDLADLATFHEQGLHEGIAVTTGCLSGFPTQALLNEGYEAARSITKYISQQFLTYVELQNHRLAEEIGLTMDDETIVNHLANIADDLGLHCVIGQDSHYVMSGERKVHDTLKRLVSFGDDPDDATFSGDGYHLAGDAWIESHYSPEIMEKGLAGLEDLLDRHTLQIPEADEYIYHVPSYHSDPDAELYKMAMSGLKERGLHTNEEYVDRVEEECEVVSSAGMANYLHLVSDVCTYMRDNKIQYQTRGSAAGSLVCWLIGITNVDPIVWGARFDRFLSKDRTKPPDIDLDVDNERRQEVLDWLNERYAVCQIGNWSVLGMSTEDESRGSIKVKYYSKTRKRLEKQGLSKEEINEALLWENIPQQDKDDMMALAKEEAFASYGTHACGVVLVDSQEELRNKVPLMCVVSGSKHHLVSQYDGPIIESIGMIKLDLLGSKTMSVVRIACDNLGIEAASLPRRVGMMDDPDVFKAIQRGDTDGIFQLSGFTARRGCCDLKPREVEDLIDAMALFRPGVMNSGATDAFIDRRFERIATPKRHEIIARHVNKTHGILLYQDQVISILREMGLPPDDVTAFLKAVKASNKKVAKAKEVIDHYMPIIEQVCDEKGMTDEDFEWLDNAFSAFANYSFNRAHSVVYGITAYQTAWMTVNHPAEYHAALLSVYSGSSEEEDILRAAHRRRITIAHPDINGSDIGYTVDTNRRGEKIIRRGIRSIKGVGDVAAAAIKVKQRYESLEDFLTTVDKRKVTGIRDYRPGKTTPSQLKGTLAALHRERAFNDCFGGLDLGEEE